MNNILILDFYKMRTCICGHDVSWHWMDMHRKGRCVYHIAELDACQCKKYVKDEDTNNELAIRETTNSR